MEIFSNKDDDNIEEKKKRNGIWVRWGLLISFLCALGFSALYGMFRADAAAQWNLPLETEDNAGWLYQNTFVLYRDLYNRQNQVQKDYREIYLEPDEGYEWLMDESRLARYAEDAEIYEIAEDEENLSVVYSDDIDYIGAEMVLMDHLFQGLEEDFGVLDGFYNYCIQDNNTGYYVTNMTEEELAEQGKDDVFRLRFVFDSAGNVAVNDIAYSKGDMVTLRRVVNQAVKNTQRLDMALVSFDKYGTIKGPRDCTVTYSISEAKWNSDIKESFGFGEYKVFEAYGYSSGHGTDIVGYRVFYRSNDISYWLYMNAGVGGYLAFFCLVVFLLGCFLPVMGGTAPWRDKGVCTWCLEFLIFTGFLMMGAVAVLVAMVANVAGGRAVETLGEWHQFSAYELDVLLVWAGNFLILTLYFFVAWYLGVCARALREMGIKEYIKRRSMIYRFFPYVKRKLQKLFDYFVHIDLTKNARRTILKLVLGNAMILLVINCLWLGGLMMTVIYSVVLYVILKKYVSTLQKRYGILLKAVDEMAEGNLNVTIEEDLGIFERFKPQVIKIQDGFKKAVNEEVKSQRMKAELITNVSHDLKTPLTAIITYVNLLKDPDLTEEQRREYLDTLERKSLRLKVLIEDLFEVSKANSGNITLNLMPVDVMNLIKQVHFEMKDKLDEADLDVRMNLPEEKLILSLDSQKTYRIYENLFGNVAKYALRGTRVYVNGFQINDTIVITIKNISAKELTVDASELTERFARGDISRNTEGSGLGLAIAKSFIELQGGRLELEVDGDLFKATTIWHV